MIELVEVDEHGFPIPDKPKMLGVWDVIDPCAMLCFAIQNNNIPFNDKVKETLDAFGWLNEDGFPDYDKMNRDFARHL